MYVFIWLSLHLFKILIDSAIDLEVPAHKTSGFVSYVYPSPDGPTPRLLKVTIPIHGRYHEPSSDGELFTSVDIQPPELLLQTEKCKWAIFILWSCLSLFSETSNQKCLSYSSLVCGWKTNILDPSQWAVILLCY